jgi:hypothetical protein
VNPGVLFLSAKTSLAAQVAQCLLDTAGEWENTEVWVPTAGAERAIRSALSRQGNTHKKFPRFCQPMEALLGDLGDTRIATRADREVAWLRALEDLDEASREALFPNDFELADVSRMLGFAGVLCDLEDLLAEGAMWPGDPRIAEVCEDDADRWQALGAASRKVGGFLAGAGLVDPNQLRLQRLKDATPGPRHLFIAAIPDLPHASAALARRWLEDSTRVTVLVWMPDWFAGWI